MKAAVDLLVERLNGLVPRHAIVLGSGGLTGRAADLARDFNVPIIDAVLSAVVMASALARLRLQR